VKRICKATTTKGKPCRKAPVLGADVCTSHGGAAPQVRAKAAERVAQQEFDKAMRRELARLEVTPVTDPLSTLADLAGQALAFKDALAARVNDLQDNIRYQDMRGAEQLRSEIALWERALDRCERFCTSMAKLNIDERLAQVSEQQATLVADALAVVMGEMGLTRDQQKEARSRVASKLRVAAG
jgi:hypothetical protein